MSAFCTHHHCLCTSSVQWSSWTLLIIRKSPKSWGGVHSRSTCIVSWNGSALCNWGGGVNPHRFTFFKQTGGSVALKNQNNRSNDHCVIGRAHGYWFVAQVWLDDAFADANLFLFFVLRIRPSHTRLKRRVTRNFHCFGDGATVIGWIWCVKERKSDGRVSFWNVWMDMHVETRRIKRLLGCWVWERSENDSLRLSLLTAWWYEQCGVHLGVRVGVGTCLNFCCWTICGPVLALNDWRRWTQPCVHRASLAGEGTVVKDIVAGAQQLMVCLRYGHLVLGVGPTMLMV